MSNQFIAPLCCLEGAGLGAQDDISVLPAGRSRTKEAIEQYHEHYGANHDVGFVPLASEAIQAKSHPQYRGCDQNQDAQSDDAGALQAANTSEDGRNFVSGTGNPTKVTVIRLDSVSSR